MIRTLTLALVFAVGLVAQTTLPAVNTVTVGGTSCTITVIDPQMNVFTECILTADGTILERAVSTPSKNGKVIGAGPIACLYGIDASGSVILQCLTDDGVNVPKITLNGKLAPVSKVRQWTLFWK